MKSFLMSLLTAGLFCLVGTSVASETLTEEFQDIAGSGSVIVENTPKATQGIDWNFELTNRDEFPNAYVVLKNGDKEILPALADQKKHAFQMKGNYYALDKGDTVRVAGLDLTQPIELTVLTARELHMLKEEGPFAKGEKAILRQAEDEGRVRKGTVGKDKTVFMVFEKGKLKPVTKGIFKRSTESGLLLDKNITK